MGVTSLRTTSFPQIRAGVGTFALRARLPGGLRASPLAPLSMLMVSIVHDASSHTNSIPAI